MVSFRGFGGRQGDPAGVGSLSATRSQDLYDSEKMHFFCCGKRIPELEISAARKQVQFDRRTATAKRKAWNEAVRAHVLLEHQPKLFTKNLDDVDSQLIFGGSEPVHVFSNKCRKRITAHVQKLAKANPKPVATTRRNKGKASMYTGPPYNTK